MTTPGGWSPTSGYMLPAGVGASGGTGLSGFAGTTELDWRAWIEAQHSPHWLTLGDPIAVLKALVNATISALKGNFQPFIDLIGDVPILGDLVDDLAALPGMILGGLSTLGGAAVGTAVSVADAIVDLIKNVAGAILGGGDRAAAAGLPSSFTAGVLRDVADGQNALIGQIEALRDNPGYCNLTMDRNYSVTGNSNSWVLVPFNSMVTSNKNAHHAPLITGNAYVRRPDRIVFDAPGAWDIDTQLCVVAPGSTNHYFEVEIVVVQQRWAWGTHGSTGDPKWHLNPLVGPLEHSVSRYSDHTMGGDYQTISARKPIVIPDFVGVDAPPDWDGVDGEYVPAEFYTYVRARFRDAASWQIIGGVRRASLSVDRKSVDTTDYGAPEVPTVTDPITPIPT